MSRVRFTRHVPVVAVLLAIAGGGITGPAVAAHDLPSADRTNPTIASGKTAKATYVVREGRKTSVVFEIRASDNVGVAAVGARVFSAGKTSANHSPVAIVHLQLSRGTAKNGVWRGTLDLTPGVPTGTWVVRGIAFDAENNCTCYAADEGVAVLDEFLVRAKTRMTNVQAGPHPEKPGQVTVGGILEGISARGWRGLERMTVLVEFRRSGTSAWVRKGEASRDGSIYYGSYPETRSGDWRLRFAPTSRYTGVTTSPIGVRR